MSTRDLMLRARWLITMDDVAGTIRNGAVIVRDDKIVAVGRADELDSGDLDVLDFGHHALLPGIVNAHTHVAGAVFRGITEDEPNGFYGLALPMERHLGPEEIYALSLLGAAEVLLAGCTTIHDMFHHARETARAASELGLRAQVAQKVFDIDLTRIGDGMHIRLAEEGERRLAQNIDLYDEWHGGGDGRIEVRFGAHAADTCTPALLTAIREEARQRGAGHHVHAAQTEAECSYIREEFGCSSITHLARNDFLSPETVVAHVLFATERDIGLLASTGTAVAHCPVSVAKIGRFPAVRALYESGARIGWGTDWVTMDPWDAMRAGILTSRVVTEDIGYLSAHEALWRSTVGSAEALGWGDRVGSLTVGKQADLVLMDLDQPHLAPLHNPVSVLVYNASGRDVTDVMVAGRFLVRNRLLLRADARSLVRDAQTVAEHVWHEGGLEQLA
jgi:5-methylthioadenosine/S-adenosylhomocysteine deaminase